MPEPHRQSAPEALPVSTLETLSSASSSSATLIPTTPTTSTAPTTFVFPTTSIRPGFKDEPSEHPPQGPPPWFCAVLYFLQYISFNLIWYFVNLHGLSMRTSREWAICGLTSGLITSPMIYSGFRTVRWISDYIGNCLNKSTRTARVIAAIGALYGIVVVGLVFRTTGVMAEVVSQNCIFVAQTGILPGASLALVFCQLHRTGCQLHHTRTHRTELSDRGMPHVDGVEMVITPIQKSQEQPGERLFGMDASPGAGLLLSTAVYLIAFLSAYTLSLQIILTSDDVDTSEHDDAVVFLFLFLFDLLAVFPCLGFSLGTSVQCLSNVFFGKPFDFRCIVGGFLGMPVAVAGMLLSGASKEMQSMEWWLLVQAAVLPGAFAGHGTSGNPHTYPLCPEKRHELLTSVHLTEFDKMSSNHPTSPRRRDSRSRAHRRHHSDLESPRPMHHRRTSSHTKHEPEPYVSRITSPIPRITSPADQEPMMGASDLGRKKSLIRPERTKVDRDHPQYHYRKHAQNMAVMPSTTGHDPMLEEAEHEAATVSSDDIELKQLDQKGHPAGMARSGSRKLHRKTTLEVAEEKKKRQKQAGASPPTLWSTYCHLITFWCPNPILKCFGMPEKAQQQAWREKMGLISIILMIAAFVGFITFGFTATVCPAGSSSRFRVNKVDSGYMIFHGKAYDLTRSQHPQARGILRNQNVLWDLDVPYGGKDGSFMFQNVNGACKGLITAAAGSDVKTDSDGNLAWYFPCNAFNQDGSSEPNKTIPYYLGYSCHTSKLARTNFYDLKSGGDVYFTWDDIKNSSRNLMVYGGDVLDLNLLNWFNTTQVSYPSRFDDIRENANVRGTDMSLAFSSGQDKKIAKCFQEIIKVGSIDTETVGCIASKIVLYVALVFILSIVVAKFVLALAFQWFLSRKYAADRTAFSGDEKKRKQQIEEWADDIYRPAPKIADPVSHASDRANKRGSFLPTTSRFTSPYAIERSMARSRPAYTTMASQSSTARLIPGASVYGQGNRSENTLQESRASLMVPNSSEQRYSTAMESDGPGPHGFIHEAVVPQPPPEWQPFGFPLAHAICLVTAYSEGPEGMRTTLDSVATTEYPNSHKLILVICDGIIKGHGETMTTPEVALSMMKEHTILPDEVKPYSYVAVASGSKRHNMAKIYSGFYDYGEDSIIPIEKQERVPMVIIMKCGTPEESTQSKPGNRGKRDSQIILMSFLQKVMFDERMTELEYEFFNGIWKITGISPDFYEIVLMVDADTKVFPDSLTHMISAMVKDPEIMGLCGETKIANKRASWVSMIQVFEYFISHHQSKSFESVFGGVTCLPGCFCMYRIKAPKGDQNYWVPILANPDIVEHYSENVVDTLHKKNLLLLGEDRYLSTLMLRTFPKRKQVFVPQAVCKTTVPDEFKVLLSQRRRWINSTVHNLMELVLVRDLCGTFCFSMQFVVFVELVGTLVLPAAIAFTFYVVAIAIKAAIEHTTIPVMSLVLLALILGLPGVLIILTAHRISYVAWMLIYLLSLPVWNFILPTYAYWKFDDFSWGDTRKTAGEQTKGGHDAVEGEFDSSKITMKRWADFEHERRMKTGGTNYNSSSGQGSYPYESGYDY